MLGAHEEHHEGKSGDHAERVEDDECDQQWILDRSDVLTASSRVN